MRRRDVRSTVATRVGSEVHLDEWVSPHIADDNGFLQAGKVLEWMDVVGVLAATRHCGKPVVTASIDGMELKEPIRLGERVAMTARVGYTSRHSVGVSVTMEHDVPGAVGPRPSLEAYMSFVPLDRRGRPLEVPRFSPETPAERARFREGEMRREFRRRLADGHLALSAGSADLADVAQKDWPLLLRQWMNRLPRYLRNPWERADVSTPRPRNPSYMHKIEPVRLGTLNFHGTLYGGQLMRWSENSASLSARAYADGAPMRCTGLHGLTFLRPIQRDRFVHIRSVVVHTQGSSLTSLVSVQSEEPATAEYLENLRAFFTYVPLDDKARIAPVECHSDEERSLFEEVAHRLALQRTIGNVAEPAA